jgi:hypothetical protein
MEVYAGENKVKIHCEGPSGLSPGCNCRNDTLSEMVYKTKGSRYVTLNLYAICKM